MINYDPPIEDPAPQPEPEPDEPPEDPMPTPKPPVHDCDEDCAPFLSPDDGEADRECSVCGVSHGDPCLECGVRGFHTEDCSEAIEQAGEDAFEREAARGDYLYDQAKDDRMEREWLERKP